MPAALESIRNWSEMIKLSHSVFALPFAVIGAFLAGLHIENTHRPQWGQLLLIVVCMVGARSVAMTFNRIVDAKLDARNPRTANRPLPANKLSPSAAWIFLGSAAAVFVAGCWGFDRYYTNRWPIILAIPVLAFLCAYSLTKRFTRWSHFYLGAAIGLSPAAAWIAIHPSSLGWPTLILTAAVTTWIAGFDLIYACQDAEHDRTAGLFSVPARFGIPFALHLAKVCHGCTVVLLIALGMTTTLGTVYQIGVAAVALLLAVENSLVKPNDLSKVNIAFFTINGLVSVLLGVLTVVDLLTSTTNT